MTQRRLQAYKDNEVTTGSGLKLVMLMYDGAIRFLKECDKKIESGDIAGRGMYISKVQKIISELQESLNNQKGGEVAKNLERVYSLILSKLTQANINGDRELIVQSILILENLRQAWSRIKAENPNNGTMGKTSAKVALNL